MADIRPFRKKETPPVPKYLKGKARAFWMKVIRDFELEPFHLDLLERTASALARCEEAREVLGKEGSYYRDDKARILRHPALVTLEKSEMLFSRGVRELGLDLAQDMTRPPQRHGRR